MGCPLSFPQFLPDYATCCVLFADFRDNFRKYESWHIRQRQLVWAAHCKHVGDLLQMELRDPAPEQVDSLVVRRQPEIVAVDVPSRQLCLASPADDRGTSEWRLDGLPVQLTPVDGCTYQLSGEFATLVELSVDSELEQAQLLTSAPDLHQEFLELWAPRWGKHAHYTEADWTRIVEFGKAYLPRGDLELAPIQLSQWRKAVRRFKPRAARGPDAFARQDLVNMCDAQVQQLLDLLTAIETGRCDWPRQLLIGLVCALDKCNGRDDANGYRPICILSMIYRCWAGIRARQLTRHLSSLLQVETYGFIPGRESSEVYGPFQ